MKVKLICLTLATIGVGPVRGGSAQPTPSTDATERAVQVERALGQAKEAVRNAKRAEELDEILAQLDELQQKGGAYSPLVADLLPEKLAAAKQFVRRWQEDLTTAQNGDMKHAREILEQLDGAGIVNWIPRSELLRRMRDPIDSEEFEIIKSAKEIVGKIKGLADLNDAMAELENLKPTRGAQLAHYEPSIYAILEAFAPLNNAYNSFKAGLPAPLVVPERKERGFEDVLTRLRAELFVLMLPRTLELPPDIHANPGEGPLPFLRRIATEAAAKNDYLSVARARVAEETIQGWGGPTEFSGERAQAALFVRAFQQEEAGQMSLAVMSYQAALATGADVIPPKIIGERLNAIKAKHPADYATGSDPSFAASQNPPRMFNYAVMAPNTLEIFPKLQTPAPFPTPSNQMVVPLPRNFPIPNKPAPSPSPL